MKVITIEVAIEDLESLMEGGDGYTLQEVMCDPGELGELVDTEYYFGIPTLKKGARYALLEEPELWMKHKPPTGWNAQMKKKQKSDERAGQSYENQIKDCIRLEAVSIDENNYQKLVEGHETSVGLEFVLVSSKEFVYGAGRGEITERVDCYEASNGDKVYVDGYVSKPYYPYPSKEQLLQKAAEQWVLVNLTRPKLKISVAAFLKVKKEKEVKEAEKLDQQVALSKLLESQLLESGGTKDLRTQDTRVKLFGRTFWTFAGDLVENLVVTLETPLGGWREEYIGVDIDAALVAFEVAKKKAKAETRMLPSGVSKPQKKSEAASR